MNPPRSSTTAGHGGGQDGRVDRHQADAQHHREQHRSALAAQPDAGAGDRRVDPGRRHVRPTSPPAALFPRWCGTSTWTLPARVLTTLHGRPGLACPGDPSPSGGAHQLHGPRRLRPGPLVGPQLPGLPAHEPGRADAAARHADRARRRRAALPLAAGASRWATRSPPSASPSRRTPSSGVLVGVVSIGVLPSVITLVFFGFLPILRNVVVGLTGVDQTPGRVRARHGHEPPAASCCASSCRWPGR